VKSSAGAKKPAPAKKPAAAKKPPAPKKPAKPRKPARVKAVEDAGQSYFDAISARDPAAMAAHFHVDGIEDIVPLGVFRGPGEVRALFEELFAAMPDTEMSVKRIVADREIAAVEYRLTGTFSGGPFQGIQPTGKRVEIRGFDCLEIDADGKITRNTGYYDGAAFARAIGMLPPQDSGAEKVMTAGFNAVTRLRGKISR